MAAYNYSKFEEIDPYNTTECVCPGCGITHTLRMFWSGRGKPRKFCQSCKSSVEDIEVLAVQSVPVSIGRAVLEVSIKR